MTQRRPVLSSRHDRPRRRRRRAVVLLAGAAVAVGGFVSLGGAGRPAADVAREAVLGARATPAASGASRVPVDLTPPYREIPDPSVPAGLRRGPGPLSPYVLTGYAWPIAHARVTSPYGPSRWGDRVVDGALFHDGIDLATFCGDRVTAAHDGVVLAAGRHYDEAIGWVGDLGPYEARLTEKGLWVTLPNVVVVDDGNGYRSIYAHFRRVVVQVGDVVRAGQLLGYEGATGRATGCHLHYGLFSPLATSTFETDPVAEAHMLLPHEVIARVDPLVVLPPR